MGNFDYKSWVATKNFQLGDVITFVYFSQFHNVMHVTHPEYRSCNVTKPIAAYATDNDSITMATYGHHYFLCGVPGHYFSQFHNVMHVTHPEYRSCNVTKPIAAYATDNDSITMATYGHHYFLCGVPGRCQSGQKVDINVRKASDIAPSPSAFVNISNPTTPEPGLSPSNAPMLRSSRVLTLIGAASMAFLTALFL